MGGGFRPRAVSVDGVEYRYSIWLPPECGDDDRVPRRLPIVLFLHGAGEKGDDGERQTTVGLGPALRAHPERWPLIAVYPQCREHQAWRGAMMQQAVTALDAAILELGADRGRQYLTGISMGGYGSWRLALEYPDRFAALVPICGGLDASPTARDRALASLERELAASPELHLPVGSPGADSHTAAARVLAAVPTWIFHGAADDVIPVSESRVMYEAMLAAGADAHYTEYPRAGHDSWVPAYGEEELPRWLLRQRR